MNFEELNTFATLLSMSVSRSAAAVDLLSIESRGVIENMRRRQSRKSLDDNKSLRTVYLSNESAPRLSLIARPRFVRGNDPRAFYVNWTGPEFRPSKATVRELLRAPKCCFTVHGCLELGLNALILTNWVRGLSRGALGAHLAPELSEQEEWSLRGRDLSATPVELRGECTSLVQREWREWQRVNARHG